MFQDCGKKFDIFYNQNIKSETTPSALVFGKAIDEGLNTLLVEKDLDKAKDVFSSNLKTIVLNGEKIDVETSDKVTYQDNDLDIDLLLEIDQNQTNKAYWSLYRRGIIILDSYHSYVLPKIKEVIVCQKRITITNELGDQIEGHVDLIARMNDGKVYLLDNKTSSKEYEKDSASKSTQLLLYHYLTKDNYNIDGVGFIVLNKNIWKKKKKICSVCLYDGSGSNHRKCNNNIAKQTENSGGIMRCNGEWNTTINASCFIDIVLNKVNIMVESLVLDAFDGINDQIKNKQFIPNLSSCKRGKFECPYIKLCHEGKMDGLVEFKDIKK